MAGLVMPWMLSLQAAGLNSGLAVWQVRSVSRQKQNRPSGILGSLSVGDLDCSGAEGQLDCSKTRTVSALTASGLSLRQ